VESTIFLVESIIIFVLSIIFLVESEPEVITLSVFTTVESVVVVEAPDPQAAKAVTAKTVNNFFMLISLILIPVLRKGNPRNIRHPKIFRLGVSWLRFSCAAA
jgi:hypothetical protein